MIAAVVVRDATDTLHARALITLRALLPHVGVVATGTFACDLAGTERVLGAPSRCAAAATWSASASLPAVSGPTNASGSPARIPPPVTRSSDVPDAMRRSPSWRCATSPRRTARVPYLVSMRAIAAASPVAPTAAPLWPSHPPGAWPHRRGLERMF